MDRKTWIAVALCILGIILYQWWYTATYGDYLREQERARRELAEQRATAPPASPASPDGAAAEPPDPAAAAAPTPALPPQPPPSLEAVTETVSSGDLADFLFNNDTGGIETAILLLHLGENREAVGLNRDRQLPIGALSEEPGVALGGFDMRIDEAARKVTFQKTDADGLEITKIFTLAPLDSLQAPYVVDLSISFRNTSAARLSRRGYYVSAGGAAPIHATDMPIYTRFAWYRGGKMKKIDVNWFNASSIPLVGIQTREARPVFTEAVPGVEWVAVTSQYFCTVLTSLDGSGESIWATRFAVPNPDGPLVYGIKGALGLAGFDVEPGAAVTRTFQIYAGPKQLAALRELGAGQQAVMDFGMFGFVSRFLLWAMNSLYDLIGNYAASIIVLTLLIKTALWPLQNKATDSMRRMAALSPKMTELREKYKDDPTKMNEELMKLYKDYCINPFGGCLPMLIQIPIFFGFYAMLGSAIELRNSSFLWVSDLSQPDTVARVFGFPINVLPLVMAGTMVWQMAITPKTGDKMQQRIFYLMPIIFLVFCYNFASALALYWTTQNIFSIFQLYLTRNRPMPVLEKKSVIAKREAAANPANPKKKRKRSRRTLQ